MDLKIPKGKYVVAVSGGVDSMVLLDLLSKQPGLELVVAHFSHGIRADAHKDEELVTEVVVNKYGLSVEVGHGKLGKNASEELARRKRYEFLETVRTKYGADAIVTAHHQDDLVETAFLNILRGTGHRGLASIQLNERIKRPLLKFSKATIIHYAKENNIVWREDVTNEDTKYLRNYIRKHLMPSLKKHERQNLISNIDKVAKNDSQRNELIAQISQKIMVNEEIDRGAFTALPSSVASECIMYWLRRRGVSQFDRKVIERIQLFLRTASVGKGFPVQHTLWLEASAKSARFTQR